jgi:hypothetical protein
MGAVADRNYAQHLAEQIGERVTFLCARYQYRGVLAEVGEDYLVLANATLVEVTGPAMGDRPNTEDPLGCSVTLKFTAIESKYQPNWLNAPLPGEA